MSAVNSAASFGDDQVEAAVRSGVEVWIVVSQSAGSPFDAHHPARTASRTGLMDGLPGQPASWPSTQVTQGSVSSLTFCWIETASEAPVWASLSQVCALPSACQSELAFCPPADVCCSSSQESIENLHWSSALTV